MYIHRTYKTYFLGCHPTELFGIYKQRKFTAFNRQKIRGTRCLNYGNGKINCGVST